jgi:alpha-tubulin suppressor-like RCC1 family protein
MRRLAVGLSVLLWLALAPAVQARTAYWFGTFIGGGPSDERVTPTGALGEGVQVQASNDSDYELLANGTVWAWGNGSEGQLGNGGTASSTTPVKVALPPSCHAVAIGQARDEGMARCANGEWYGWGQDSYNSLCHDDSGTDLSTPVALTSLAKLDVVAESGGGSHTMWLSSSGRVYVCGNHDSSGLGATARAPLQKPTAVPGIADAVEITGSGDSCVRGAAGEVWCWGPNELGQIGDGCEENTAYSPVRVPLGGPAEQVAAGGDNFSNGSTAALIGGELVAWGNDEHGKLGDGGNGHHCSPVQTGLHFASIAVSGQVTFGITATGQLYGFGNGAHGMLGNGGQGTFMTPQLIQEGVSQVSSVAQASMTLH